MEFNNLNAKYEYNYDLDIVNIKAKKDYIYEEYVDLETGVFLDFDKNYFPVNLEILSISKRLNVDKEFLINPEGNVTIVVDCDLIKLNVIFKNNDEQYVLNYCDKHGENLKLTDCQTSFALV